VNASFGDHLLYCLARNVSASSRFVTFRAVIRGAAVYFQNDVLRVSIPAE
jgi:hypothetical protein